MNHNLHQVLAIAGSDTSGGAGMQADLKTYEEYGVNGLTALTCIVTMDPTNWNHHVDPIDLKLIEAQIKTVLAGPKLNAVTTGMLPNAETVLKVAEIAKQSKFNNLVVDPVMVCKGEDEVLNPESSAALREALVPEAFVTTPNLFEAGQLAQISTPSNLEEMKEAAKKIYALGVPNVIVKGGKTLPGDLATDILYDGKDFTIIESPKIPNADNHGAGCTFAAAITAGLARNLSVKESFKLAKEFVDSAISGGYKYNKFIGPVMQSAYRYEGHNLIDELKD